MSDLIQNYRFCVTVGIQTNRSF